LREREPAPSSRRGGGPPGPPAKRLDGITRELYALIGDNACVSASASPDKAAALAGFVKPMRLQWAGLRTALVKDLTSTLVDGAPDNKFAKFNTSSQPYSYNDAEYDASPDKAAALAGFVKPMRLQWAGLRTALVRSLNLGLTETRPAALGQGPHIDARRWCARQQVRKVQHEQSAVLCDSSGPACGRLWCAP
jgi:hypothetical protein